MQDLGSERTGRERKGPVCEGSGWSARQGTAVFFQVKLIGYCNWQKLRLQMAAPTLAESFNCLDRGLTVFFCTRHPPVSKFGLQWSSPFASGWAHVVQKLQGLGTHFQRRMSSERDKRGEGD